MISVVSAAIVRDGALLVVRKRGTGSFMLPGGKAEPGESEAETLRRELHEELGCRLRPEGLGLLGHFEAPAANERGWVVRAAVYRGDLDGTPVVAAEIAEMLWLDVEGEEEPPIRLAPLLNRHVLPALRVPAA
ncbi:NUDIX hydrolase [Gluconacetobacter sacchari]|uniref:NUDIX hydrolase n=1 Tax=Gluconacetobacter sacchari TaxID=92759 RepID=UPI002232C7DE|nr:NUDIX domain-containing protein [Gluconacetobacter sacchari]